MISTSVCVVMLQISESFRAVARRKTSMRRVYAYQRAAVGRRGTVSVEKAKQRQQNNLEKTERCSVSHAAEGKI